jgi:pre-rRNA-processing protein TSR4
MSDADSDYDEQEDAPQGDVELGFVVPRADETDAALALHALADWGVWDGGKVGGAPRWLVPASPLPSLPCAACGVPLSLLLQIYCPLDAHEQPDAFHRALYVFVCKAPQGEGCAAAARVLRAQLPRVNGFYAADGGAERFSEAQQDARREARACAVCAQHAPLTCGQCRVARYCGKEHQREHWAAGGHKADCARW